MEISIFIKIVVELCIPRRHKTRALEPGDSSEIVEPALSSRVTTDGCPGLPLPTECWDHRPAAPHPASAVKVRVVDQWRMEMTRKCVSLSFSLFLPLSLDVAQFVKCLPTVYELLSLDLHLVAHKGIL